MKARIYHSPRCSKSRAALTLLTDRAIEFAVVDSLATPLSKTQHPHVLQRPIVELGGKARVGRPPERVLELFE